MTTEITYESAPSYGPIYRKILFGKKRPGLRGGATIPDLTAVCSAIKIDEANLAAYHKVCHIPGNEVPILYPHVMTGSLHLALMSNDAFPLSMMGAVHLRNHVLRHRPLAVGESYAVRVHLAENRITKSGIEIDATTTLESGGARVWESISTYLVRGKFGEPGEPSPRGELPEIGEARQVASWHVPPGTGRKYAKVCGDYNPIHISPLTAKLFGFKRDITHGMWSAAVSLAKLENPPASDPVQCDLLFKGPTFMNSTVRLMQAGDRFDLYCAENPKPSIVGKFTTADAAAGLV